MQEKVRSTGNLELQICQKEGFEQELVGQYINTAAKCRWGEGGG